MNSLLQIKSSIFSAAASRASFCSVAGSIARLGAVNCGTGATYLTLANPNASTMRMYNQRTSHSYHLHESFAEVGYMVIVVQLLAADENTDRHDVGTGVRCRRWR